LKREYGWSAAQPVAEPTAAGAAHVLLLEQLVDVHGCAAAKAAAGEQRQVWLPLK